MTRIRTFALLAFAAVVTACSDGPTSVAAPDRASYDEIETCRGGWITSSGRWVCPGEETDEP